MIVDGPLEPLFSSPTVTDAGSKQIDTEKAVVDSHQPAATTVMLPTMAAGRYIVHWVAAAADGHRTHGGDAFDAR
ncbi:hypothetical protein DLM46_30095 [Paraburkholderia lacunae]|uniref:CopC domain-containing protein n=2 Tax=Paraburkholderia lacunae TaxID=2211104 RepID=A0A370N096_9BURK|nr:hypothetical protein DLM46_30095 [Paraburkholderia lacunae]